MSHGDTVRHPSRIAIAVLLIAALGGGRQLAFAQADSLSTTPAARTGGDPEPVTAGRSSAPFTTELKSHVTVHADVSATELVTKRWKILIPSAIQALSQQHIKFIDGMQTVDVVEAYTEKADGRRVPVAAASILTQDAASGLQATYLRDQKQKTIIYPDVAVGDTLVLTARLEQRQGTFPRQFVDMELFPRSQSFTAAEVTVDAPVALDLQVRTNGRSLTDEVTVDGEIRHHRIALVPEPYRPEEPKAVSPLDREPMLLISTFKSYEEIGKAYGKAALPKAAVTPQIAALADEITKNIDDRRAQAVAIDAWVKKNIRYVAVYLALGRVVPNDAAQVLTNRFGDCKDKVTLMTALLAAKGIASEAALVNATNGYTLPDPPQPQVFNHVIVYLPDFDLYDDPTVSWAAFGVLAPEAYDKPVVRVSATDVRVARTPAMRPEDHIAHATTSIKVAADGTVTGETKESNTGMFGIVLRLAGGKVQTLGETAASRQLQAYGTPGTGHFDLGNIDDTVDPAVVTGSFKLKDKFKFPSANARKGIPLGMPLTVRPGNFLLGQRLADRQSAFVCLAGQQIEDIDATFDAALPMPVPLVNANVENPLFIYHSTYAVQGRTLKIHREFVSRVPGQVCSPAVETEIAADMNAVRSDVYSNFSFAAPGKVALVATAGQKRTIDFLAALNVDCTSIGFTTARIVEQPQHGVAAAENGTGRPNYPQANPRSACNKQQVPGTVVTYQSQPDFAGADSATLELTWPTGAVRQTHYAITVNPAPLAAAKPSRPQKPAAGNPPKIIEAVRGAMVGQKRTIDFLTSLDPDCSSLGFAAVRILEQPQHGVATAESGTGYPAYPEANPRSACNKQRVSGTLITYQSQSDFTGTDSMTVETSWPSGALRRMHYAINVNPAPIAAPSTPQVVELKRTAAADQRLLVAFLYDINPDCSPIGFPTVRVAEQPKHGKLTIENGTGFSTFPEKNLRFECNKRRSEGVNVSYDPEPGFTGADAVVVDIIYPNGSFSKRRYAIDVR